MNNLQSRGLAALVLLALGASMAVGQQLLLIPYPASGLPGLRKQLDQKLLPDGAKTLRVQEKQTFQLLEQHTIKAVLASVCFDTPIYGDTSRGYMNHCGIYLLESGEAQHFFDPSDDAAQLACINIAAVRLKRHPGQPPDLLLTGDFSIPAHSLRETFEIDWRPEQHRYEMSSPALP